MSRMTPLEPPYEEEVEKQFGRIMQEGKEPLALFRTIARSPRAWKKFRSGSLLDDGPLTLREREIVINRVCARTGCEYEWGVHVAVFAERAGLTEAEIDATVHGSADADCWSGTEQVLISTVDALHDRSTLSSDEYRDLSQRYDTDQIFEILMLAGFYRTVSYLANGLALPLEDNAARFPKPASASAAA
ncbi:carboxymuconolactone decarboxylase family protein [Sphingomonas sp. UYP23]